MKKILVILIVFAFSYTAIAQYTIQDSDVTVENGIITECVTDTADWGTGIITIPAILDDQTVTSIGMSAFSNKGITNLTINAEIIEIGTWAFYSNPITEINFSAGIINIKGGAFEHCSLKKIELPDNIEHIYSSAFGYNSIDSIIIPKSVNHLGSAAFQHNNLKHVEFEAGSNIRLIENHCFYGSYNLDQVTLPVNANTDFFGYKDHVGNNYNEGDNISDFTGIYYADLPPHVLTTEDVSFKDNIISDYSGSYAKIIIPTEIGGIPVKSVPAYSFDYRVIIEVSFAEGLTEIENGAFMHSYIKKVTFPNTLKRIGSAAFTGNAIDTLLMPDSITSIAGSAFSDNILKHVEISRNLKIIESNLFENNLLDSINIPDNITNIGEAAFSSNLLLKIEFPVSVTYIGNKAFANNKLSEVFLHDNIVSVGSFAFANNAIDTIRLSNNLTGISDGLFENNIIDTVIFPEQIKSIGDSAFSGNSLNNVYIPNQVTYIGNKAFANNLELISIELPDTVFKEGYGFMNWQNNSDSGIVTSIHDFNASYTAMLEINIYNVVFQSDGNGILEGDTIQLIEHGNGTSKVTAIANSGYRFVKWQDATTGDSITYKNPITLSKVTNDTTLIAIFTKEVTNSINEEQSENISIYPNPVVDFLKIESSTAINSVEIIDINGVRRYYNNRINSAIFNIDMNRFSSGIYFIIFNGDYIFSSYKIIVK